MRLRIALIAVVLVTGILVVVAYPVIIGGGPVFDNPGGAAGKLLRGGVYPWLTIEIDTEVELPAGKVARIVDFVDRYTDKLIIVVSQSMIDVGQPTSGIQFSVSDLKRMSTEHRNTPEFSFMAMSIHILVIDGTYTANAVGVAFGTTNIAVFLRGGTLSTLTYIDAIISHEIGHLLGLNCVSGLEPPAGSEWFCDETGHNIKVDSLMAQSLNIFSGWVLDLELQPSEVDQLEFIKANQ